MRQFVIVIAATLALLAASTSGAAVVSDAVAALDAAERPAVVRMSMLVPAEKISRPLVSQLLGLSWSDCGSPNAWVKIHSVSVQPDPVSLSGKITVAVAFTATHSFGDAQPLAGSIEMSKKVFGTWIKLPCINNVGSCSYANLCTFPPPPTTCPPEFVKAGVPCKCPFPAGNYTLPSYSFTVDASKIPKFLESGDYKVSVNANAGGNQVLCVNAELSLN